MDLSPDGTIVSPCRALSDLWSDIGSKDLSGPCWITADNISGGLILADDVCRIGSVACKDRTVGARGSGASNLA